MEETALTFNLSEDETIDDLEINGYRIIQSRKGFRFGMDAVLLSGFASACDGDKVIDLGTGCGIIPILLKAKTAARDFTGLEISEEAAGLARRSVRLNGLKDDIKIITGDIKEASELFGRDVFDVVTCNPPYIKKGAGFTNPDDLKALARHEILCSFEDVAREAAAILKSSGNFYLVHRPERLAEVLGILREYSLEPKRLRMVHSFVESEAVLFLLKATLGASSGMRVEAPLIVYKEKDVYTDELRRIYGYC